MCLPLGALYRTRQPSAVKAVPLQRVRLGWGQLVLARPLTREDTAQQLSVILDKAETGGSSWEAPSRGAVA